MNINEQLIQNFYAAFARLDYTGMQGCYSADAIFNDPVFGVLEGNEVKAMWQMLCTNAKDFSLAFTSITADEAYGTCEWQASYTFSKTGRHVINNVKAHMRIEGGRITEHTDEFSFYTWSRQALGLPGMLLGWSGYLKNKVRQEALKSLHTFMAKNFVT